MPIKVKSYEQCLADAKERRQNLLDEFLVRNNITPGQETAASITLKLAGMVKVLEELDRYWTADEFMTSQKELVKTLAPLDDEVIITGPTGTGKEILATALAAARSGPFIPINCAALNETLIESELFGHVKGAFTDAKEASLGVLRAAEDGTVFLDDIDKMSPRIQPKLLRAIQEKEVRPVGSTQHYKISCRFIAASKVSADSLLDKHGFLEDLYGRISTFEVRTTPYKQRPADIDLYLSKMFVPPDHRTLDPHWQQQVDLLNARGLYKFCRWYHVISKKRIV